jgi:hypothetical protein
MTIVANPIGAKSQPWFQRWRWRSPGATPVHLNARWKVLASEKPSWSAMSSSVVGMGKVLDRGIAPQVTSDWKPWPSR